MCIYEWFRFDISRQIASFLSYVSWIVSYMFTEKSMLVAKWVCEPIQYAWIHTNIFTFSISSKAYTYMIISLAALKSCLFASWDKKIWWKNEFSCAEKISIILDCKKTILVKKWLRKILRKIFLALKPKFLRFCQNKKTVPYKVNLSTMWNKIGVLGVVKKRALEFLWYLDKHGRYSLRK